MKLLHNILVHRRSHDSEGMDNFLVWWKKKLSQVCDFIVDAKGNIHVRLGRNPTVMHSAHLDTVHNGRIPDLYQKIQINTKTGIVSMPFGATQCLGADDGAGLYILYELIRHGRPGLYVMHVGEERGGIGSHWLADHYPETFEGITHCFAYDRKGTRSVITHQAGGRCCSDNLADIFSQATGLPFEKDPTGSFTDSACYTHLIPECTNISVGYYDQHTPRERQDTNFLDKLTRALVKADLNGLPVYRQPKDKGDGWHSRKKAPRLYPALPSAKLTH